MHIRLERLEPREDEEQEQSVEPRPDLVSTSNFEVPSVAASWSVTSTDPNYGAVLGNSESTDLCGVGDYDEK